jgi:hypothetical protein
MNLNMSPDMMQNILEAFKDMGVDDSMVQQALKLAAQQPSAQQFRRMAQLGGNPMANKLARQTKTMKEMKSQVQKSQKAKSATGERMVVGAVSDLAQFFEQNSGGNLKQWQMETLFKSLGDNETAESIAEKVSTYTSDGDEKADARTIQKAYAFLESALPDDDPLQKEIGKASTEHRRANITEITVSISADLLKAAEILEERGIENLASPEDLKEFFDSLLDEMADAHRVYSGWSNTYSDREFQLIAKVTSHLIGEAIHDLDPFTERGLLHALTTGTSRVRAYTHAFSFFKGRERLMNSMMKNYEAKTPSKYNDLPDPKADQIQRKRRRTI